jgi:proliferating cell nuclear antigen
MKLILTEPKYLKDSLSIVAELVTEAKFRITSDYLELVAMDPANVAMVIFRLLSSSFAEYNVESETEIGLNLVNFKQILKRVGPNDSLTLEVQDTKLNVKIEGSATRTFSIPLLDMEERNQKVPELNFPVKVSTDASLLTSTIEDADIVAESVAFSVMDKKFIVAAEGDLSKANIEIPSDDLTVISSESDDSVKAKYSIEYLKKMISGSKVSSKVDIMFNTDYPLKLEYKVVDKMLLAFILAPRVEND